MDKSNWSKLEFRWKDLAVVLVGVAVLVLLFVIIKGVYS